MPKITSVEPQKKNPHRFNIFIDGEFVFGADQDLVVDHRLMVGKIIEKDLLDKLIFEAEVGKLMERMYGLLGIRARSEKEIRDYLKNLSFKRKIMGGEEISQIAADLLINKLKQKGLLNDSDFAKTWINSRSKKKGKIALRVELIQKGIDKKIIDQVLEEEVLDEQKIADQTIEKKMKIWKDLEPLQFKKKAYEYLLRRGFEYSLVSQVVEKYLKKR